MKKLNRKIAVITNVVLVLVFTAVFAVSFFPENIMPIYGGQGLTAIYNGNRENKKVTLMFNCSKESRKMSQYAGMTNLISEDIFDGTLNAYEMVILKA